MFQALGIVAPAKQYRLRYEAKVRKARRASFGSEADKTREVSVSERRTPKKTLKQVQGDKLEKIMDIMLIFVFVIAAFLGLELIAKVPSQLHTPLMSGTNAISGITVVGAISITAAAVKIGGKVGAVLGFLAIVFATINVIGGYMVTDRMLGMFKTKDSKKK